MVDLTGAGFALILVGMGILAAAVISSRPEKGGVKGAGVVMIGPIPIVFGSDAKWATVAIVMAVILVLLSVIFYAV
jgi:uncharacterized protein (TIGR00304 family)